MLPVDERLAAALPAGSLFAVGGRVRDELRAAIDGIALAAKDLDYVATGLPFDELQQRLARIGRVDAVGASFAVLKVTVEGQTVDVSVPRRERSTGAGHRDFSVESGPSVSLEDDLARRDFRMNMMARAIPLGTLIDPYGGEADVRARRIDILTLDTFREDPLRLLRAAQFCARFGYGVSDGARYAMRDAASTITTVSPERIHDELMKLLAAQRRPSAGIELLRETGILAVLLPEIAEGQGVEQNEWHAYDVYRHNLETLDASPAGDPVVRLACLLHDVGKPRTKDGPHFYRHEHVGAAMATSVLQRLRFPNDVVGTVEALISNHMYSADPDLSDAAIRRFVRRIGLERLERQFALRHADIAGSGLPKRDDANECFEARVWSEVARKPPFSVADLAIDGAAVIELLVARGEAESDFRGDRRVGDALRYLFEQVTEVPERNEPNTLRVLLERYFER